MNLLVIEDEVKTRQQLIKYINEYNSQWVIKTECSSIETALTHINQKEEYDLIISDIELTDGNIINVLHEFSMSIPIIFVTAYDQYMQEAFETNCIHYINKPIKKDKLHRALNKFQQLKFQTTTTQIEELLSVFEQPTVKYKYKQKFLAQYRNSSFLVDVNEIAFFEIESGVIFIKTEKDKLMIKERSLDEVILYLNPRKFMRINRSIILNKEYIEEIKTFDKNTLTFRVLSRWLKTSQKRTSEFRKWINS